MIAIPGNVRVWLATGHTDMRRGFPSLARLVQESLKRDPHIGDLYVFRGRRGDLIKIIWHDGQGACLFTKRLERGRFLWPSLTDGVVTISVAQLYSREVMLPGENIRGYEALVAELVEEWAPEGPTERGLVDRLVGLLWRRQRLERYEHSQLRQRLK